MNVATALYYANTSALAEIRCAATALLRQRPRFGSHPSNSPSLCNVLVTFINIHALLPPEICQSLFTREKLVNILEFQTLCLGEEEVDDRHPSRIEHRKDDVCSPADVANRGWCNLNDDLEAD